MGIKYVIASVATKMKVVAMPFVTSQTADIQKRVF